MIPKRIKNIKINGVSGEFYRARKNGQEIPNMWLQVVNERPIGVWTERTIVREMNGIEKAILRLG